jgi:hypothetical protein
MEWVAETEERIEIGSDGHDDDDYTMNQKQPLLLRKRINNSSQQAIVGANICPIQSLDYELVLLFPFFSFLQIINCHFVI